VATAQVEEKYNFEVVRWFTVAAVIYLVVGTLIGVYIASELAWPILNLDIAEISFGRLRPLHTNAVIFAFGGCALMGTAFYTVQRTCGVPLEQPPGLVYLLGLEPDHCRGCDHPATGLHPG